ncbi:MAG: 5-formyltetrahydrofolate cyclo-ligase [Hyphomicrobiales bacterium]|nr:MAG: 5-formyltetrahydrofolate cyclo-ligase [Hyphomicrobiales bacterium]
MNSAGRERDVVGAGASDDGQTGGTGSFASPPCYMHVINPAYGRSVDPGQARDVARWRKAERERLIAARLALSIEERIAHADRLAGELDATIARIAARSVSLYWPFRGEPDLRQWMHSAHEKRLRIALPLVVAKGRPLVFRAWRPGAPMARGAWNIPYPVDGEAIVPEVVIASLVGFDAAGFRLGYGGGYFDRTLASLTLAPIAIGVGHPFAGLPTINPQAHDIAMDWILTGDGHPRAFSGRSDI